MIKEVNHQLVTALHKYSNYHCPRDDMFSPRKTEELLKIARECIKRDFETDFTLFLMTLEEAIKQEAADLLPVYKKAIGALFPDSYSEEPITHIGSADVRNWQGPSVEAAKMLLLDCYENHKEVLCLKSLQLPSLPIKVLKNLPWLKVLKIVSCDIPCIALPRELVSLESFSFSNSESALSIRLTETLPNLTHVKISRNPSLLSVNFFESMPKLRNIVVSNNKRLHELQIPYSSTLPSIRKADFSKNNLITKPRLPYGELEIALFTGNPRLTEKKLFSSRFCAGVNRFRNKLAEGALLKKADLTALSTNEILTREISTWLSSLCESDNFCRVSLSRQQFFAEKVLAILAFAARNPSFHEYLLLSLHEANTDCVDKSALYLNAIHLEKTLFSAFQAGVSYKGLLPILRGAFALQVLEKLADDFVFAHRIPVDPGDLRRAREYIVDGVRYVDGVDPVEVYLNFQTTFQKEFSLPIAAKEMNFRNFSHVTTWEMAQTKECLSMALEDTDKLISFISAIKLWQTKLKNDFKEELETVLSPYFEELELLMISEEFLQSSDDVQKALAEPVHSLRNQAEQLWIQEKTRMLTLGE